MFKKFIIPRPIEKRQVKPTYWNNFPYIWAEDEIEYSALLL